MKNVLIISFSQTSQANVIAQQVCRDLYDHEDVHVSFYEITLKDPFPYPWDSGAFFDAFPETFQQIPREIAPPSEEILNGNYDLVIFSYQVWYLTPSLPVVSFLKSEYAEKLLSGRKVISIVSCRNMWAKAHDKTGEHFKRLNAERVGHIALVDRANNYASVITIVHWLYSGKKTRYLGFFPLPGVSDKDIEESERFGQPILQALLTNNYSSLQKQLIDLKAVEIKPFLIIVDRTANKIFSFWSKKILTKKTNRKRWVTFFKYYLLFALWIISPIVLLLYNITYPLRLKSIRADIKHYQSL